MKRILTAVHPRENAGALVILAAAIVDKMDGSAHFPKPVPTLAKLNDAMRSPRSSGSPTTGRSGPGP